MARSQKTPLDLIDKDVEYPDIVLDEERYHPLCSLSQDRRSVSGRSRPPANTPHSQSYFAVLGTCGTDCLSGRVYWQVRIALKFATAACMAEQRRPNLGGFAVAGVVSQDFLRNPNEKYIGAVVVKLYADGTSVRLSVECGRTIYDGFLAGVGDMDGRIGFLLDTVRGEFTVVDISSKAILSSSSIRHLGRLRPLVCLPELVSADEVGVRVTIESGNVVETFVKALKESETIDLTHM